MKKYKGGRPPFVMLEKDLFWNELRVKEKDPSWPWWELSTAARDIYMILKSKYNGQDKRGYKTNNGKLTLFQRDILSMRIEGLKSSKRITAAFKELIKTGWIIEECRIGGRYRWIAFYRLTFKWDILK